MLHAKAQVNDVDPVCEVSQPRWQSSKNFTTEKNLFEDLKQKVDQLCSWKTTFFLQLPYKLESMCDSLHICNQTQCYNLDYRANKFITTVSRECIDEVTDVHRRRVAPLKDFIVPSGKSNVYSLYGSMYNADPVQRVGVLSAIYNGAFVSDVMKVVRFLCV